MRNACISHKPNNKQCQRAIHLKCLLSECIKKSDEILRLVSFVVSKFPLENQSNNRFEFVPISFLLSRTPLCLHRQRRLKLHEQNCIKWWMHIFSYLSSGLFALFDCWHRLTHRIDWQSKKNIWMSIHSTELSITIVMRHDSCLALSAEMNHSH